MRKGNPSALLVEVYIGTVTVENSMEIPLVAQTVKNLPAMLDTQVQSLVREYPLEEGMATHSNILAWRIPWTEEPGGLSSMESQRTGHD